MSSVSARRRARGIGDCVCTDVAPSLAPAPLAPVVIPMPTQSIMPTVAPPPPPPAPPSTPLVYAPIFKSAAAPAVRNILSSPSAIPSIADVQSLLARTVATTGASILHDSVMSTAKPAPTLFGGGGGGASSSGGGAPAESPDEPAAVDPEAAFAAAAALSDDIPRASSSSAPSRSSAPITAAAPFSVAAYLNPKNWSRTAQIAGGVAVAGLVLYVGAKAHK